MRSQTRSNEEQYDHWNGRRSHAHPVPSGRYDGEAVETFLPASIADAGPDENTDPDEKKKILVKIQTN